MNKPPIVSPQEWESARQELLVKEKELTHARDALAAQRRRMPWLAVEKEYEFDGPEGRASLLDLFDGRRQLIVYRAFFEPGVSGWPEHACIGCSMVADQVAHPAHLNARHTTLTFVSRAPQADIERLKARMGWELIPWYTLAGDFDADFGVDEWHGTNAFIRDGDQVFRTYFVNARAATRRSAAPRATSTSLRSGARKPGRTRRRATPRLRRTSGGSGMTKHSARTRIARASGLAPPRCKRPTRRGDPLGGAPSWSRASHSRPGGHARGRPPGARADLPCGFTGRRRTRVPQDRLPRG